MVKKNPIHVVRKQNQKSKVSFKKKSKGSKFPLLSILLIFSILLFTLFLYSKISNRSKKQKIEQTIINIPSGFSSVGIDVSHHQENIDWKKLFSSSPMDTLIDFVYCKTTEGISHVDTRWEDNRNTLKELGVTHGAYHFFTPSKDPILQAKNFLQNWNPSPSDLAPVLDVETESVTDEILLKRMKIWLEYIEKKSGIKPIIYTSAHFYATKFKNEFKTHKFWIASYSKKPSFISDERIIHWQYSEEGILPGFTNKIDMNVSKLKF